MSPEIRADKHPSYTRYTGSLSHSGVTIKSYYLPINGREPPYLQERITPQTSSPALKSKSSLLHWVPNTKLHTTGLLLLWNRLPDNVRAKQTRLKTFFFPRKEVFFYIVLTQLFPFNHGLF